MVGRELGGSGGGSSCWIAASAGVLLFLGESSALAQSTASFPSQASATPLKPATAGPDHAVVPGRASGVPSPAVAPHASVSLPAPPPSPTAAPTVVEGSPTDHEGPAALSPPLPSSSLAAYRLAPALLPYRQGLPVPSGYRVEHRSANGLIIGGLTSLIVGYTTAIAVAGGDGFKNGTGWAVVPVVGPWAAIGARAYHCDNSAADLLQAQTSAKDCVRGAFNEVQTIAILSADAVVQATGAVLFLAGLASGEDQLLRTDLLGLHITPRAVGRNGFGLGFDARF